MNNHLQAYRGYAQGVKDGLVVGMPKSLADVMLELLDEIERLEKKTENSVQLKGQPCTHCGSTLTMPVDVGSTDFWCCANCGESFGDWD